MSNSNTAQSEWLINNPFYILDVSFRADRRAIVAAADERSFFQEADKCAEAQNALLNPAKRLSAELDWFPDTDEENIVWIKQPIESGERIPVREFGIVSQLNAELYNLGFFDMTQPQQLVRFERTLCSVDRLYSRLDGKEIAQMLNQHRKAARMTEVSVQEVEQELIQKRYRIRRVLSECLQRMSDADCTEKVLKIAQTYIEDNKGNPGIVLLDFVSQYELRMQPKIDALSESIDTKINFCKMRTGGVLDSALDDLMKEVAAWAALAKPMMICGKANGRSYEGTSAMGNKLRNLALYLHNEKEQSAAAAKLTEAMLGIFIYDRMFHNKLTEEAKTLKKLSSQRQNAEGLKEEIDLLLELVNSAEKWSSTEISDKTKEVAVLVCHLNKKLRELAKEDKEIHKLREIIAMAARSVAVMLQNKHNMTQMAADLMDVLVTWFKDMCELSDRLKEDWKKLSSQCGIPGMTGFRPLFHTNQFERLESTPMSEWFENKGEDYHNKKDYKNAFIYYKRAAEMGNAEAQNLLGILYHQGNGVPQNYEEALRWYHKAAEQGHATAMSNIGNAYERGWGVKKDNAALFQWKLKAAEKGDASAINKVGYLYFNGIGIEQDYGKARAYFEKSATMGNATAMLNLGNMYCNGHGVTQDKSKALYWYGKSADNGNTSACEHAGRMYEYGEGTKEDHTKAKKYYLMGSERGDHDCTAAAARIAARGTDAESKKEAFRLCNLAIQHGTKNPQIYRILGELYMTGQGTKKNYLKARKMLHIATRTSLEGRSLLKEVTKKIRRRCLLLIVVTAVVLYFASGMMSENTAISDTETAISNMGTITIDSKAVIEQAEAMYAALSEKSRAKVENYAVLQEARQTYDDFAYLYKQAKDAIEAIPYPVNLKQLNKVEEARKLYNEAVEKGLGHVLLQQQKTLEQREQQYTYSLAESFVEQARDLYGQQKYQEAMDLCNTIVQDYDTHDQEAAACAGDCFDTLYNALYKQKEYQKALDLCKTIMRNYDVRDEAASEGAGKCFDLIYKDLLKQKQYQDAVDLCERIIADFDVRDDVAKQAVSDSYAAWAQEKIKENRLEEAGDILGRAKGKYELSQQWEKVNDSLTKKLASSRPANGKKLKSTVNWGYCEFTVKAGDEDVCLKLESLSDPSKYVLLYVHANENATVKVADGMYIAKYTTGKQWYGEQEMFGKNAKFSQADDIINFSTRRSGNTIYYSSVSITIYKVLNGNLETIPISPGQF